MARIGALLFAIFASFIVCIGGIPTPEAAPASGVGDIINALGVGLVTKINVFITPDSLTSNLVSIDFDVQNPLLIELTLDSVKSTAGIDTSVFASFDHKFATPLAVPPLATKNSGPINNVLLTQGIDKSLEIVPLGFLDLIDTDAKVRAATINGKLGIPIPLNNLKQKNVTATYTFDL